MSGSLTAKFELTLSDQLSAGLEKIEDRLGRVTGGFDKLGAEQGLERAWEKVPRCTEQTDLLAVSLDRATGASRMFGESLDTAGMRVGETGNAFGRVSENATALGSALERTSVQGASTVEALNAITGAAERAAAALDRVTEGGGAGGAGGGGGRIGRSPSHEEGGRRGRIGMLHTALEGGRHFGEQSERAFNHALGAGAAGFALVEPVESVADYQNTATHIGITLGKEGIDDYQFADDWQRYINRTARRYGQKSADLMESGSFLSMEGYSEQKMRAVLPSIAEISTGYNAEPDAVGRTAFALQHNLHLSDDEVLRGLADLARVGKISALDMRELAPLFPDVAAHAGGLGMHGLRDVADIGAMLAVARKSVGQAGSATADMTNFMQTLTSQHGIQRIGKVLGIDSVHQIVTDVAGGRDPMEHFIDEIAAVKDPEKRLRVVTSLFANQQDQSFARSLSTNILDYRKYRDQIRATTPQMIQTDYDTARQNSDKTQLDSFEDSATQMTRHIGRGFLPILNSMTTALNHANEAFDSLEKNHPYVATGIVGGVGATLAAGVGIGVLGAASGPLRAGYGALRGGARGAWSLLRRGVGRGAVSAVESTAARAAVTGGAELAGGTALESVGALGAGAALEGAAGIGLGAVAWPALAVGAAGLGAYGLYRHFSHSGHTDGTPVLKVEISLAEGLRANVVPNAMIQTRIVSSGPMLRRP